MPTLKIDGKEITVASGTTIMQAARANGISIPHYCWHPGLSISGNCRICLVEVEKMPRLQISCHIQCQDGMVVHTKTDQVKEARQGVLEFLLVNHPLDCPVCDQAGECKLQDYYMKHGLYESRLDENKIKKTKKAVAIGPTVMLDSERCILCSRCVRFCNEITKTGEFGIFNRGDHSEIGLYPGKELNNKYSGNVVDICPVGALTDRDFRFKCRVWYLQTAPSVCPGCSRGCNINIETNLGRSQHGHGERVMRLKPRLNADVNEWWICDDGRYGYKFIDHDRVTEPVERLGKHPIAISWKESLMKLAQQIHSVPKEQVAIFISPQMTNEELFMARRLFVDELGIKNTLLVRSKPNGYQDDFLIRADKHPNRTGAKLFGFEENENQIQSVLNEAEAGKIKVLVVFGQDLVFLFPNHKIADILKKVSFSVLIGSNHHAFSSCVQIVLPAATYAEKEGTFTNFQGFVQRICKALPPFGESKSEFEILTLLAEELGLHWSYQSEEQIFDKIAETIAPFKGLSYKQLGKTGTKISCG